MITTWSGGIWNGILSWFGLHEKQKLLNYAHWTAPDGTVKRMFLAPVPYVFREWNVVHKVPYDVLGRVRDMVRMAKGLSDEELATRFGLVRSQEHGCQGYWQPVFGVGHEAYYSGGGRVDESLLEFSYWNTQGYGLNAVTV